MLGEKKIKQNTVLFVTYKRRSVTKINFNYIDRYRRTPIRFCFSLLLHVSLPHSIVLLLFLSCVYVYTGNHHPLHKRKYKKKKSNNKKIVVTETRGPSGSRSKWSISVRCYLSCYFVFMHTDFIIIAMQFFILFLFFFFFLPPFNNTSLTGVLYNTRQWFRK